MWQDLIDAFEKRWRGFLVMRWPLILGLIILYFFGIGFILDMARYSLVMVALTFLEAKVFWDSCPPFRDLSAKEHPWMGVALIAILAYINSQVLSSYFPGLN